MYAVIKSGGKQYKVAEGEFLRVEKLEGSVGDSVCFDEVLLLGGDKIVVGAPVVSGATVAATIVGQVKDKKILVFKSKRRKDSRKLNGHRQPRTVLKINKISA